MKSIINKPYKAIWYSILFLFGLSLISGNSTTVIQLHDMYFVITSIHIGVLISIYLGIIGIVYWLIRKKRLVDWMTVIHVVVTILTFALIIITGLIFKMKIEGNFEIYKIVNKVLFVVILISFLSQLLFLANLIFGSIRNKPNN